MLASAGHDASRLQCGCHLPMRFAATGTQPAPDETFDALSNNCSGKHAAFLAWCALRDAPRETYLEPEHPLQRAVREAVARACDVAPGSMTLGIDGCSAPNYAMPLAALGLGYARLAAGEGGLAPLRDAMVAHPELVSGEGRNDLALMRTAPGDWVAKVGADGVQAIGVRSAGLGIAVKIAGGDNRAACIAAIGVLRGLGLVGEPASTPLAPFAEPELRNARGRVTGRLRTSGHGVFRRGAAGGTAPGTGP
jgi:L-asparaginase II